MRHVIHLPVPGPFGLCTEGAINIRLASLSGWNGRCLPLPAMSTAGSWPMTSSAVAGPHSVRANPGDERVEFNVKIANVQTGPMSAFET